VVSPWWWVAAISAVIVQLVAVYWPGTPGGEQLITITGADKVVHALIFGVPTYLLASLTRRRWLVGAIFAAHAPISELVQWRFLPYRDGDVWDMTADLVGIAIALLVWARVNRAGS
jgi:VanZ like family.